MDIQDALNLLEVTLDIVTAIEVEVSLAADLGGGQAGLALRQRTLQPQVEVSQWSQQTERYTQIF